jgi:hypothetical protein
MSRGRSSVSALEEPMDDKTITAISTSLALMQIQVNALLLLFEQQTGLAIRDDFQRLISEGVQTVGVETMQGIKSRIYEGIVQRWRCGKRPPLTASGLSLSLTAAQSWRATPYSSAQSFSLPLPSVAASSKSSTTGAQMRPKSSSPHQPPAWRTRLTLPRVVCPPEGRSA